jgi:pimeloyl-ACP methyl ester carboxylesterase
MDEHEPHRASALQAQNERVADPARNRAEAHLAYRRAQRHRPNIAALSKELGMRERLIGIALGALATGALVPAATHAQATAMPPPDRSLDVYAVPGRLVDIGGGRHLNLRCSGKGAPTVLLDGGQGSTSMSWRKVQPLLAATHRVCSYDRAGLGFSDAGPLPRTAQAEADDLRALVRAAKLETPLILVGHSLGSYVARLYAGAHRSEVAGLVLVDPISETLAQDAPAFAELEAKMSAQNSDYGRKCGDAARKGDLATATPAAEACVPPAFPGLSQRLSDSIRQRYRSLVYWETSLSERDADVANIAALKAALPVDSELPLVVLAADGTNDWVPAEQADLRKAGDAGYAAGRERIARQSARGRVVAVTHSSHDIPEEQPAAIAQAVAAVTAQIEGAAAK